jgi:hypothetical protein
VAQGTRNWKLTHGPLTKHKGTSRDCAHATRLPQNCQPTNPEFCTNFHGQLFHDRRNPLRPPHTDLTAGQNEVPQGRPSRHHHPRQICRPKGTIFPFFFARRFTLNGGLGARACPEWRECLKGERGEGEEIERTDGRGQKRG